MRWSVRITKRAIDVAGAAVGLAVLSPLLPIIAAAIYLDSPGPVLFRQRRAGRLLGVRVHGGVRRYQFQEFCMHKFRTMCVDAESTTGAVLAGEDDPRITRVGKILRKTRLDETPQLFDVLRGSMSLVGPRPERPELLEDLSNAIPLFEERMRDLKPGITGLAQISLNYTGGVRKDTPIEPLAPALQNPFHLDETKGALADDMRLKLLYDLAYGAALEKWTAYIAMEARIITQTPVTMMRGLGQ